MQLDYSRGAIPLYLQIKKELKSKIESKDYPYGSLLPSELELEKCYGVSRITIRQAISELEKEGYVRRARGKGTTITYSEKIDENLSAIRRFTTEMKDRGLTPGTQIATISKIMVPKEVAEQLELEKEAEVYYLYRVRTGNEEPVVLFETYIPTCFTLSLDPSKYYDSMYDVFEEAGIGMPCVVHENFQAMLADERLSKALNVKKGSAIFKRVRCAYNEDNKPIEYTISYYRGDRYSYSVELTNRK